jgi:hypothetical protein
MSDLRARRSGFRAGVAASVLLHLIFVAVAILSLPRQGPPPEPPAARITLVPLARLLPRRVELKPRADRSAPAAQAASPRPLSPPPLAAPASPALAAPAAEGQDLGKVREMLRGSVGCSEEQFLHMSQKERDRCAKWRLAQVKPGLEIPAPIAAEKRAWYDAIAAARAAPDHPPGVVCFGKPAHGLKLGPLPCYVEPPKGPLTEDVDAPSEPDRRR